MLNQLFVLLTWFLGIASVLGTVGTVAVIFLAPTMFATVIVPLLRRFLQCLPCIVAAVFVVSTVGAYWVGHHSAVQACDLEKMNSAIAAAHRDAKLQKDAADFEANRALKIQEQADAREKEDAAFISQLKERSKDCGFDSGVPDAPGVPNNGHNSSGKGAPAPGKKIDNSSKSPTPR